MKSYDFVNISSPGGHNGDQQPPMTSAQSTSHVLIDSDK